MIRETLRYAQRDMLWSFLEIRPVSYLEWRTEMSQAPYLTAQEAATELGVKLPTLYAYVSRGLIRSEISGNAKRERLYSAEDVQHLKQRQEQRRDPTSAVAGALH